MSDQSGGTTTRRPTVAELAEQARQLSERQDELAAGHARHDESIIRLSHQVAGHDEQVDQLRDTLGNLLGASRTTATIVENHQQTLEGHGRTLSDHESRLADVARAASAGLEGHRRILGVHEGRLDDQEARLGRVAQDAADALEAQNGRLDAFGVRLGDVEATVEPDALRATVTQVVDERLRVRDAFNWAAFAVVMAIGFVLDLFIFTGLGRFNSAEAPKLSKHLTEVMHTQNFLAVLAVVAALAILAGMFVPAMAEGDDRPRQPRPPREGPNWWQRMRNRGNAVPNPAPATAAAAPTGGNPDATQPLPVTP